MNILIACDSFKDALAAPQVCAAIHRGIVDSGIEAEVVELPMADGGEGTAEILRQITGGERLEVVASDPLFRKIPACLCFSPGRECAYLDMAQISGLQLLTEKERNPMLTTTFGTGELMATAMAEGVQKIILGIGGSATNDAGMGLAIALGFHFRDKSGKVLKGIGQNLIRVESISQSNFWKSQKIPVDVLCDVKNPLFGKDGAAEVYARQKGADDHMVSELDRGLRHFSQVCGGFFGKDYSQFPGAGAAGGLGYGLKTFLNAELRPGTKVVFALARLKEKLKKTDLVITGEGKIDGQTQYGKLIKGICDEAVGFNVPVIALCGKLDAKADQLERIGLKAAFSINDDEFILEDALRNTKQNLILKTTEVIKRYYS